jgi:hypothetical protein
MTTRREVSRGASGYEREARRELGLARDERGAVLLMGVFMCSALGGMLW